MCGIFAVYNHESASEMVRFGLHALQHRGEEATGIVSSDGQEMFILKKRGLVGEVFSNEDCNKLKGHMAIGHVRYSTQGGPSRINTQPLFAKLPEGDVAICHNGQITNSYDLRKQLEGCGSIFQTSTDTEIILHCMAHIKNKSIVSKLKNSLQKIQGAYSLLLLTNKGITVVRDSNGIRPLVLGKKDDAILVSSESCAIHFLGGNVIRDIMPGEMLRLDKIINPDFKESKLCIFEHMYFSRVDSILEGKPVYRSRVELGKQLAIESFVDADICIPVPDSGIAAAIGFSNESKIPYGMGIIRAHYSGRSFIQPDQNLRNKRINMKLAPVYNVLKNKRVIIIDDSIVRGNTSKKIISMIKNAGAKEIHFRVASPPVKYPCYYGIDTPKTSELIASSLSVDKICDLIGCDSLSYLSHQKVLEAIGLHSCCDACFTGKYL